MFITEVVLSSWISSDPKICSSLRWLATDTNNGMHQLVLGCTRKIGVLDAAEVFNPNRMKTKLIMVVAQLVYTLATLVPVPILWVSYTASTIYLGAIYLYVVWRGSSVYMTDWAERYGVEMVSRLYR